MQLQVRSPKEKNIEKRKRIKDLESNDDPSITVKQNPVTYIIYEKKRMLLTPSVEILLDTQGGA